MILRHCIGSPGAFSPDLSALILTAALALVYFGSRRFVKRGISPILLIGLSAAAGIVLYGGK